MSDSNVKFNLNGSTEEEDIFYPPGPLLAGAHVRGFKSYHDLYSQSINNPDHFWKTVASEMYFERSSDLGLQYNFVRTASSYL